MKHSEFVKGLVKPGEDILKTLTPAKVDLIHAVMGLAGEVGEIVDAVKKHVIYDQAINLDNVEEESGDIEFYMEQLRQNLHLCRLAIIQKNIKKLKKRYPKGYSNKAAKERKDKLDEA